jgi:hypothetical protein
VQSFSKGRLIAGCVIGVACGLLLPLLMITSAWFLPIPILFAILWVWAGWPTVLVGMMSVTLAGYLYWNLGWGFAAGMVVISLPGVIAAALTERRMPFYRAVGVSAAVQLFSMLAVTAAAWLFFRQNLVDVMTGALRGLIDDIPVYYQHYLALQMGQLGAFGSNTGINFSNAILTDAQLQSLIDQLLYTINEGLKLSLPAYVLASGAATGAMSYAAAAWVRVRRGDDPAIPFVKPVSWRLSANLIVGPPAMALVCVGLMQFNITGAEAAYLAAITIARLLYTVQAVGVLERRLKMGGMAPGKRTALIVLALVIAQQLMPFVGMYSALFGSQGLISKQIRKRMDGKVDE